MNFPGDLQIFKNFCTEYVIKVLYLPSASTTHKGSFLSGHTNCKNYICRYLHNLWYPSSFTRQLTSSVEGAEAVRSAWSALMYYDVSQLLLGIHFHFLVTFCLVLLQACGWSSPWDSLSCCHGVKHQLTADGQAIRAQKTRRECTRRCKYCALCCKCCDERAAANRGTKRQTTR